MLHLPYASVIEFKEFLVLVLLIENIYLHNHTYAKAPLSGRNNVEIVIWAGHKDRVSVVGCSVVLLSCGVSDNDFHIMQSCYFQAERSKNNKTIIRSDDEVENTPQSPRPNPNAG